MDHPANPGGTLACHPDIISWSKCLIKSPCKNSISTLALEILFMYFSYLRNNRNLAISYCNMTSSNHYSIIKWINPTYEMIYEITKPYEVFQNTSLVEFNSITVMNPNGTISEYKNQYPHLIQSGSFNVIRQNFGEPDFVSIYIRGYLDIGNGTSVRATKYFFFHVKSNDPITLKCTKALPCTIIVRQIKD